MSFEDERDSHAHHGGYCRSAGNTLFRLYNGFAASNQKVDQTSLQKRLEMLRHVMDGESQAAAKPRIRTPRYRRRLDLNDSPAYPVYYGGRRTAAQIQDKLKHDSPNTDFSMPSPRPAMVKDTQKERLQLIFEWSGSDEKAEDLTPRLPLVQRVVKGSREEKEKLLDSIAREVDERESFLRDMKKFGKQDLYKGQIFFEVQQRVEQMKQLDKILLEDDAHLLATK